jgi:4-carboxymuconolactone decarboxylase
MSSEATARWEAGLARYREVYGEEFPTTPRGVNPQFDLMIEQLFAEVWTRPGLGIPERRLLTMGVLAAQGRFDVLTVQFRRGLATGEFTPAQVQEIAIHLINYVGYPSTHGITAAVQEATGGSPG